MSKDKKINWWKWILIIIILLWISLSFFYSSPSNEINKKEYTENTQYKETSRLWDSYRQILDDDFSRTLEISKKCEKVISDQDIKNCINELIPQLDSQHLHLIEAKTFLSQTGNAFSNRLEMQADLDNRIVIILTVKNHIDQLIRDYNANIQSIQNQQEITQAREQAIYDVLDVLSGIF